MYYQDGRKTMKDKFSAQQPMDSQAPNGSGPSHPGSGPNAPPAISREELLQCLRRSREELEEANRQLRASAERSRILAEEAIAANRTKSEFMATISHEVRTPLNAILGFAEVLAGEPLTEEQQRYVHVVRTSADNLLALVNDILDFSQVEAGKLHIDVQPCRLDEQLHEIRELMEPQLRRKGLELMIDMPPQVPAIFHTDPLRLRQCLLNLVGNAVKFTQSGYVAIRVRQEPRAGQQSLRFDVEDTGIGIEEDKLRLIFDSFAQGDHSITRPFGGTGLGLAITRRLTSLLGGHVEVRSRPGQGSTFSIILPLFAETVKPTAATASQDPEFDEENDRNFGCVGRILLIEENPPSQLHLNLQLRRGGLEMQTAGSIQQALERLERETFDLILLDWNDPHGAAAIKDFLDSRNCSTPLIGVIQSADPPVREEFLRVGCRCVLVEPVTRRQLYETIRSYLLQQKAGFSSGRKRIAAAEAAENMEEIFEKLPKLMQGMMEVFARSDLETLRRFAEVLMDMGDACGRDLLAQKAEKLTKLLGEEPVQTNLVEDTLQELHQLCMQISMHC
jgi:signal transduction histidine kinase/DNA-binding response OmpR family regulator